MMKLFDTKQEAEKYIERVLDDYPRYIDYDLDIVSNLLITKHRGMYQVPDAQEFWYKILPHLTF